MRQWLYSLLAVCIFVPTFSVSAQTPLCGNIITPADFYYEGDEEIVLPIADCSNPFNKAESLGGFSINRAPVTDGAQIEVSPEGVTEYGFVGDGFYSGEQNAYFKHTGSDFVAHDVNFLEPAHSEIVSLINQFFNNQTNLVERYTEIYFADDLSVYFQDENYDFQIDPVLGRKTIDVYNELSGYVADHLVYKRTPFTPGTYTIVEYQNSGGGSGVSNNSMLDKILAYVVPTAHAQSVVTSKAVTFTLIGPAPVPIGASSVLFLPGIMSSRLYADGALGTENQLWEANRNDDVRRLAMATSGTSINQIYTRDIPGEVYFGYVSIYDGFIHYLDSLVTDGTIKAWTPFAYDWRYSVDDVANNGAQYQHEVKNAVDEIQRLASSSFSGKVTVIGHSNGGLLAKAVMIRLAALGKSNLIDTVVLLASPQLGTPKAIASMLHGYDQEIGYGYVVDDAVSRDAMKNMPGAYGLVPSQQYFTVATSTIIRFDNSTTTQLFRTSYGSTIDSLAELSQFMTGSGDGRADATTIDEAMRINGTLLQKELSLHASTLDNWVAPTGVRVIEVVGTGLDTISGFEYRGFTERVCGLLGVFSCTTKSMYKPVPLISQLGDKTVMGVSAEGYQGEKEQYFIDLKKVADVRKEDSVEHFNITENPSIQVLVRNILKGATSTVDFVTPGPQTLATNRIMLGSHSPVSLEVKDTQGRRVGRGIVNGLSVPITDIPGSSYFELGSSTYVIVPDGGQYSVVMKGTGQGGLTFSLDTLKGEQQTPLISVQVATITPSTTVNVSYTTNTLSNVSIDQNSDGVVDQILTPQGVDVTPKVTYMTLKTAIQKLPLSNLRKAALMLLATAAETFDKNPKLSALELLTLNKLEATLVSYQKNNWITQNDLVTLKGIISKLK